jgi:acryloyl-coenzyme A reductase
MSYRALQLAEPGAIANFRMVTLPLKQPTGPGSVQVKVQACAVAYRDVLDRQGAFKFIRRPTVLGHEFAGTVTAVADGPSRWRVGDRVCSLHWDQAAAWPSPLNATGAVDSMFGLTCDGGYAEYCNARTGALVKAPSFLNSSEAASVMSTFGTVWNGAVVRGGLASGQTLLVTGASGGVGSSAVMLGAAMGNRVIAVTTSEAKVSFLTGIGAASVIVADSKGAFKPPAERVDMVLEAVGGPTFKSSLRSVAPGGSLILVGNVTNATVDLPLGYIILNSIKVVGSDSIAASDYENGLTPFMAKHKLKPVVQKVYGLADAGAAHELLEQRGASGRLVLQIGNEW